MGDLNGGGSLFVTENEKIKRIRSKDALIVCDLETQDFSPNALNWMNLSWDQSIMILSQKADRVSYSYSNITCKGYLQSEMDLNLSSNKSNTDSPKTSAKLLIVKQPEEQHRARYLSEGSRGAIKDRSGTSHCTIQVKLLNYYVFI
jgi:hypothetical protein